VRQVAELATTGRPLAGTAPPKVTGMPQLFGTTEKKTYCYIFVFSIIAAKEQHDLALVHRPHLQASRRSARTPGRCSYELALNGKLQIANSNLISFSCWCTGDAHLALVPTAGAAVAVPRTSSLPFRWFGSAPVPISKNINK
jgi:hypothetical protein